MATTHDASTAGSLAAAWKQRAEHLKVRDTSAHLRELAADERQQAAAARDEAASIRDDAARIRDNAARDRDSAARVRDSAARLRDQAAHARDLASHTREEALRVRLLKASPLDRAAWQELLDLDSAATKDSRDAADRDRDAVELDRTAANKDRDAAERDRTAMSRDADAANKDRDAAERDRTAAETDRSWVEKDRGEAELELELAETWLAQQDRLLIMGRLTASLAHEINNPLATLTMALASMQQTVGWAPTRAVLEPMIADATFAAQTIAQVVADMQAWMSNSDAQPARQELDLAALVRDACRLTGANLNRVARLVVDVQPTCPVWGVHARLAQVLTNLLLNAAHAVTGPRDANEICLSVRELDNHVHLVVRDSGSGITPDVLPHIFDPYFTTRTSSGGTGLGLSLCQRIIADHGGLLGVVSEVGVGSTFTIDLPCGTADTLDAAEPTGPTEPTLATPRARVLLIDDNVAVTRSMTRLLAPECEVIVAANGREGLERLLAPDAAYDLVLCDLTMPVMNGIELYTRLQAIDPRRATELVFLTGGATSPEAERFLAELPNVQLQKPFEVARLLRLIDERLGSPA